MNPNGYHGEGKKAPYFEGWYFKLVDASGENSLAIIPGIYKGVRKAHSQAFVQVLDGKTHAMKFWGFSAESFTLPSPHLFCQIENNRFAASALDLDLPNLKGSVNFHNIVPWPVTALSPGIMGWFAWMPFMECYHGVVSLDHNITGSLEINGRLVDFTGGRGYIEKDWGQSFPSTWIWMQANHFDTVGTSLTASVARIPFKGLVFPGFIVGLWHAGKLHRFTTYVGATLEQVEADDEVVTLVMRNLTHRLVISAERSPTALLLAPTKEMGMVPKVNEGLDSTIHIHLTTLSGRTIYESSSKHGGLEVEGSIAQLRETLKIANK